MRWCSMVKMGVLKFRNVLLALVVDHTARDAMKVKFTGVPSMSPLYMHCRYLYVVSPCLSRHQRMLVELANSLCFSLFDDELTQRYYCD